MTPKRFRGDNLSTDRPHREGATTWTRRCWTSSRTGERGYGTVRKCAGILTAQTRQARSKQSKLALESTQGQFTRARFCGRYMVAIQHHGPIIGRKMIRKSSAVKAPNVLVPQQRTLSVLGTTFIHKATKGISWQRKTMNQNLRQNPRQTNRQHRSTDPSPRP